ncbi:hypothetical protein Naga_102723g1 [Nannochloropsis gaditana]|uniref:Uncharacterized protein n=1 Tax=Nannochloropsis gaditana TaxID=72520 RepID=W7TRQ6_9STRA|nr:hypothetical protein Naga_102723g1 [Nannochloropsis gaditana]
MEFFDELERLGPLLGVGGSLFSAKDVPRASTGEGKGIFPRMGGRVGGREGPGRGGGREGGVGGGVEEEG